MFKVNRRPAKKPLTNTPAHKNWKRHKKPTTTSPLQTFSSVAVPCHWARYPRISVFSLFTLEPFRSPSVKANAPTDSWGQEQGQWLRLELHGYLFYWNTLTSLFLTTLPILFYKPKYHNNQVKLQQKKNKPRKIRLIYFLVLIKPKWIRPPQVLGLYNPTQTPGAPPGGRLQMQSEKSINLHSCECPVETLFGHLQSHLQSLQNILEP